MLYNTKWDRTREANLNDLISWLEGHDPTETYSYSDSLHCLAAQYNGSLNREYRVLEILTRFPRMPLGRFDHMLEEVAVVRPHNFGAALKRAKRIKANYFNRIFGIWY